MRRISVLICSALLLFSHTIRAAAEEYPYQDENHPPITSDYLYLEDIDNHQVLWSVQGDTMMYPASLTKVMSAVILIENCSDPDAAVLITDDMWSGLVEANASVAGFWPGDEPTVRELLYGILLSSGADAVNALAIHYYGSIDAFVEQMNQKAAELGMNATHFTNCTGLHNSEHYSTAHDITILMDYALQNDLFCEMIRSRTYTTRPLLSNPDGLTLTSTSWPVINLDTDSYQIPGYLGGKTGFTNPAGRCLTSHAEFNGMHLVLTTGHSEGTGHIADAESVYSWYAANYARTRLVSAGDHLADVTVVDTLPDVAFEVAAPETIEQDIPIDAQIEITTTVPETVKAPLTAGDTLGTMTVLVNGQAVYETAITASVSAPYSRLAHAINAVKAYRAQHSFLFWVWLILLAFVLLILILRIRIRIRRAVRRAKRKKKRTNKKTNRSY